MANGKTMDAIHKEGGRKLTQPERGALEKELSELKSQLDSRSNDGTTQSRPDLLQNRPAIMARQRKLEELLNKDDDLVARGDHQRGKLSVEAKEIEKRLASHMLTDRERGERMTQKRAQDYELAVQKTVHQQRTYLVDLQRWQEIMRQLYPDDPTMCDVRRIKPS